MDITRRNALLGATAAVVVTGAATAALAVEPVVGLGQQLRTAIDAWSSAEDAFEDASHRVGFDDCYYSELVTVETSDGPCCWGASEIRQAVEDGRQCYRLTPEERDAAIAEIERRQRERPEACRALGLEPLWQEVEHWKARFWDLHVRLLDMPATTPRGVLAKLRCFYHDEETVQIMAGYDPTDDLPAEWAASIYRDLERLAREARS